MFIRRSDLQCAHVCPEIYCRQIVTHLAALVTHRALCATPQLRKRVLPPALDLTGVEDRTGVVMSRRDGARELPRTEVDVSEQIARLVWSVSSIFGVSESELTVGVVSPTTHRPIVEQHAGVFVARGYRSRHVVSEVD